MTHTSLVSFASSNLFRRSHTLSWVMLLGAVWMLATGCGSVYTPRGNIGLDLNPEFEINDEDIRTAYEARPQLPSSIRVAYLSFDDEHNDELDQALRSLPGVEDVYRIPDIMVSGQRRFDNPHGYSNNPWQPSKPLSIKKLRLLAARAGCDALLIVDNGHRIQGSPNGLVALSPLLVTVFFVPMSNLDVDSYMEAFLIDVRNGYLYGHVQADRNETIDYVSVFSTAGERRAKGHYDVLLEEVAADLGHLLQAESTAGAPSNTAPSTPSIPSATEPAATPSSSEGAD
ncbi:MAG: hypothetical protein AAFX99_13335 [Myxococcota bacterium]